MNIRMIEADRAYPDFLKLVQLLDEHLVALYGADVMEDFHPLNALDGIIRAVVIYCDHEPCACGGIKRFDDDTAEIKRMFVKPEYRRLGLGSLVMQRLEALAADNGFTRAVLETAANMTAAQALYRKRGFMRIENYAPYENNPSSVCFEKTLTV